MRFFNFRFRLFLAVACFLSVTWIKSIPRNQGFLEPPDVQTLYERLEAAELRGGQVRKDLSGILEQLKNISKGTNNTSHSNITSVISTTAEAVKWSTGESVQLSFIQPNIHLYLPHLREHPDSLRPHVVLGQGRRGVSLVLGIPTVKREKQSYLVNTLGSLLYSLTSKQKKDILIIVFVAETDSDYVSGVAETIRKNFPKDVASGLLEVVSPSQYYYPDFSSLTETLGDSKERVKWRTKQNLDFSFLMLYAQDKGSYYVQLEDDVEAKSGYYDHMKKFVEQEAPKPWLFLEFSQLGFIGKMFRDHDLPMIVEFFLMFHRDKPVDWLLDHILWVKMCHPEKDAKHCNEQKESMKRRYKPSLFQHVGLHSSLKGKIQNLKDKDFGKQTLFVAHSNPPAELSSSLKHYQQHSLQRAYNGEDFFWAFTPLKGDYILIRFSEPTAISRFLFHSGNIETRQDKFYNTTVEVLPKASAREKLSGSTDQVSDDGFIRIGAFEDGVARGDVPQDLQPISALRLSIQSDADLWAVLSEIDLTV